ncbi:TetR/AcrR family transcriptional regulator [Nocardia sp. CDC153]|uniref:TetR/AcrR family transcriptional regulator n=1 Tax=Nocardia sp. CDC153 TaxID=3112167 RepID=UPI002DBD2D5A|nr:TetR/AcrR family transcriptional regulator [Nocardia sp. CDC153]MEC3953930.1 TetR/AcrR family transcriptional regulator [Nocardia sp. CDC153]
MTGAPRIRQRLSAETRREQLEVAAVTIVGRDGLAAATAEAVARAADVSKGLLWRYYTDLDDLILHAGRRALTTLEAAVASDVDLDTHTADLLRAAIRRAAVLPSTHGDELRAARRIARRWQALGAENGLAAYEYKQLHTRQAALIQHGQQRGQIRADLDPHLLAVTYQGMVDTMLEHLDANPDIDPLAYADHVADVLLGGIATTSPQPSA